MSCVFNVAASPRKTEQLGQENGYTAVGAKQPGWQYLFCLGVTMCSRRRSSAGHCTDFWPPVRFLTTNSSSWRASLVQPGGMSVPFARTPWLSSIGQFGAI